jgi:hypothetical protein
VAHSHGLTDEEYAAIRALQEAGVVPAVTNLVWEYLLSVGLVRVDTDVRPPTVRLTPSGRSYPTD